MKKKYIVFILLWFFPMVSAAQSSNPWNGKVVLQGFWWSYTNKNYPNAWSNYLADLAPRLRSLGIDAVWIPPACKNSQINSVGYSPFDTYDLGDKYQKSTTKTILGSKDEFLRMIAVLKANGVVTMHDIVLNHLIGAETRDPLAITPPGTRYKTFRYTSYATPITTGDSVDYMSRRGRFPKNANSFNNPPTSDLNAFPITTEEWGPDINYLSDGTTYMRKMTRDWFVWYVKQTGAEAFRFDAVKHFPTYVIDDVLYNVYYPQGIIGVDAIGDQVLSVGEWIGQKSELDAWTTNVNGRAGTFDFGLHGFDRSSGLMGAVYGGGGFDLSTLPSLQQDQRNRTFPFMNNHDTFRPVYKDNGDYLYTWSDLIAGNTDVKYGQLYSDPKAIDPREPRFAAIYAAMMAMPGSPVVFFDDLFDMSELGNRYLHLPYNSSRSSTGLPIREDIARIIRAHQKFNFKSVTYKVRSSESAVAFSAGSSKQDLLIIERSAKAIIAVNDQWNTEQEAWINTDFPAGTKLKDYSETYSYYVIIQSDQRAQVKAPGNTGSPGITTKNRGYAIWAPQSDSAMFFSDFAPTQLPITQTWEMADDIGDSHALSLGQGGTLPKNSTNTRTICNVFLEQGKPMSYQITQTPIAKDITISIKYGNNIVYKNNGSTISFSATYIPPETGWYSFTANHVKSNTDTTRLFCKVTYTAPKSIPNYANQNKVAYSPGSIRLLSQGNGTADLVWDGPSDEFCLVEKISLASTSVYDGKIVYQGLLKNNKVTLPNQNTIIYTVFGKAKNVYSDKGVSVTIKNSVGGLTPQWVDLTKGVTTGTGGFGSSNIGTEGENTLFFTWDLASRSADPTNGIPAGDNNIYIGLNGSGLVGTGLNLWVVFDNKIGVKGMSNQPTISRASPPTISQDGGQPSYGGGFEPKAAFCFYGSPTSQTQVESPAAGEYYFMQGNTWTATGANAMPSGVKIIRRGDGNGNATKIQIPFSDLNIQPNDSIHALIYLTTNQQVAVGSENSPAQWPTENPNGGGKLFPNYLKYRLKANVDPSSYPRTNFSALMAATNDNTDLQGNKNLFFVYPNPASSHLFVRFPTDESNSFVNIQIISGIGQIVYSLTMNVESVSSKNIATIPLTTFISGIYFCRILINNKISVVKKFIVFK